MKYLTVFLFSFLLATSLYSQSNRHPLSYEILDLQANLPDNIAEQSFKESPVFLDTAGAIPGLTQYYDYVTNGANLKKIFVLGDTIVIACDFTDSLNSSISTARRTYFNFSVNGGSYWETSGIYIMNSYTSYPDLNPVMLSGSRTVAVSGLGAPLGGFAGVDVILGAGSFTNTGITGGALESSLLSFPFLGCVSSNSVLQDSLFFRKFNYSTNQFSSPLFITTLQPNARYYITTSSNGTNVFIMWWNSTPNELKARESTNGGNTFGPEITVCPSSLLVNGDAVTPWYAADLCYKPGTTTPYAAFSTLAPGNFGTAQGSKVLLWSPVINGGNPVKIVDWRNMNNNFLNDTAYFNNNLKELQVGITPVSHPSIAFSSNSSVMVCVYSSPLKDTTSYGFHYNYIYSNFSTDNGSTWSTPYEIQCSVPYISLANPGNDQIYPSVSKTGNLVNRFYITYSLSAFPGSASFTNTNTPKGKVYQIFKYFCPTGGGFGITTISSEIPKSYLLEQNYPNPFNPKTIIRFDILKTSDVKITIFDITGREVQRLVRQKLNAGKYSVDFDSGNLSSGVYFYSIIAGDFIQTKKMVLVK
ncbi:MAG: T9SS type A sorting domain-containing protein [Ignavibacteria bacterium]|nr:T9SS type A sorting domain-containing protein [Ignavibacteria bacterium]